MPRRQLPNGSPRTVLIDESRPRRPQRLSGALLCAIQPSTIVACSGLEGLTGYSQRWLPPLDPAGRDLMHHHPRGPQRIVESLTMPADETHYSALANISFFFLRKILRMISRVF